MEGRLDLETFDAPALRGNPLGDPSRRPVYLYRPPGYRPGLPAVFFLHGFTGSAHSWTGFPGFGLTVPERLDRLVSSGARSRRRWGCSSTAGPRSAAASG